MDLKNFNLDDEKLTAELDAVFAGGKSIDDIHAGSSIDFEVDSIVKAKVVTVLSSDVVVDIGYKSEGFVSLEEWEGDEEVNPGDEFEVVFEGLLDEFGVLLLSKRKADKIRGWERLVEKNNEGDVISGKVIRKIKGGLLVDVGVPVFLPASQVDIRKIGDIAEYIGKTIEAKIIKIDEQQKNVVISRRQLIEERRAEQKTQVLDTINIDEVRTGVVKNITDFGAFIDLGGIDGLLHITDMSWGRVSHPSEVVTLDEKIEVKVLSFDRERERISLGLKQKSSNPWVEAEAKYPVGAVVRGKIVNIVPYGAFVMLESGIEGLVHVSEMSWTKQIKHASEVVSVGDIVEVAVLGVNVEKEEISLGMKQVEENPWETIVGKYPEGTKVSGRVRNLTGYGAFIEIEEGIDGLLHVSDMSWTKKVFHPGEVLKKGDAVDAVVLEVDIEKKRIALGVKQLEEDPWINTIPDKYPVGTEVTGVINKLTNFGAFVEIGEDLEALLHISEIGGDESTLKPGDKINAYVLSIDSENKKISLAMGKDM